MADKLFSSDLRAMERALREAEVPAKNLVEHFADLDKHARDLASSTDELQDQFGEVVDITKKFFDQEKGILHTNIQNVDITKEINKAIRQGNHGHADYLKSIEGEFKAKQKIQKVAQQQLNTISNIGEVAGQIPLIGGGLSKIIGNFGDAYKEALGGKNTKPEAIGKGLKSAFKGAGLAIALYVGKNLFDSMQSMGSGIMDVLSRPEFIFFGKEARAIADEFGNMDESSMKIGLNMKLMSAFSGVSAENQAKIMGMMAATSDSSLTTLHAQMKTYKQAGVPFRAIMEDVAGNTEFFAKFSKDGGANIFDAAKRAKELGVNLSDVASITDSLVDFESSIQKQMEAQVLLGRNINLDRARALAFSGDQVGMMNEVVKQVGGEVEFNKMNVIQRKALADSIGLSVEKMAALVREEQGANKEANKQFGKFIGIGVIIGGIVGLIASLKGVFTGGVSVPKDLLTIAAMTGGGAAIGGGLGATAAAAMPSFQGLPEGRAANIRSGTAMAHAGESVVRTENINMDRTNELLERLVGETRNLGVA